MHVCLFDIDGTLVDTAGAGGYALMSVFSALFDIAEPRAVAFSGRTDRGIATDLFEAHGIDDHDDHWRQLRDGYLQRLPSELPKRDGRVLPGVAELVEQLASRKDVALGLLTGNLQVSARMKLEHFDLAGYFHFGGFGDTHYHRNDVAHDAMLALASHVGDDAESKSVWVIGDTPLDIECARSIDANVVAVATGMVDASELEEHSPDLLLHDLTDTQQLLEVLCNAR